MARFFLSSLIFLMIVINFSTAGSFHKRSYEEPRRYCDHAFLEKSSEVLRHMKMYAILSVCVNRSWQAGEWYGQWPPKSKIDFREFCCKIGCNSDNFIDYRCYTL
ncbi:hypothetical protein PRIPAC_82697 [Pristionchus pacificus]|uniref:Uncharacterized protein n=1 Tax=Pristionchus pacificus TaxID=54126 RepID=A0A2A6C3T4_PRIPA|nr:hypothetical protein PRIPAC_82697 [Pristionchus pacificus]|eukprot:PDM72681.1 hypothetical protein PRIPAC_39115 [Pristionchus pacificus]